MIKVRIGYGQDQYHIIPDEEAHIAYHLFIYSDKKAMFPSGVAIRGQDIISIEPAWQETMGWNPSHKLTSDDWNEIRDKGIDVKLTRRMSLAKEIAPRITAKEFSIPLPTLIKQLRLHA